MGNWGVLIREIALTIISKQETGKPTPTSGCPPLRLPTFETQGQGLRGWGLWRGCGTKAGTGTTVGPGVCAGIGV